jgi:aminoglycoside phosphotransferase (APT) family kinase protein
MRSPPPQVKDEISSHLDADVCEWDQLDGGRSADTHLLILEGEPDQAVCKIGGPSVRTGDVIEPLVLDLVDETTDLPAPAVLTTGALGDDEMPPWAVYEFREGEKPTPYRSLDLAVQEQIVRDVGSILGELHTGRQFDRMGGLARDGDELELTEPEGANFPSRGRSLLERVGPGEDYEWEPVLSHGDLYPGNLLVDDDGSITGLVDWGNAHVTTAGYTLARAQMRFIDWFRFRPSHRRQLYDALQEGYCEHRELPDDYPDLSGFYETLWLAQSADRIRRHAQTAQGRQRLRNHVTSVFSRGLSGGFH